MYGIIPIAKIEKLASAPPPNVLRKPTRLNSSVAFNTFASTFGTGMKCPDTKND